MPCVRGNTWDSENEPHYDIEESLMVYWSSSGSDKAVCPEELLVADALGLKKRENY